MKLLTLCILTFSLWIYANYKQTQKRQSEQWATKVITSLTQDFQKMYRNENLTYSIQFKELGLKSLSTCSYNLKEKQIILTLNTPEIQKIQTEKHLKNIYIHELEYCSNEMIKLVKNKNHNGYFSTFLKLDPFEFSSLAHYPEIQIVEIKNKP